MLLTARGSPAINEFSKVNIAINVSCKQHSAVCKTAAFSLCHLFLVISGEFGGGALLGGDKILLNRGKDSL